MTATEGKEDSIHMTSNGVTFTSTKQAWTLNPVFQEDSQMP